VLWVVLSGLFTVSITVTILVVSLQGIADELHSSVTVLNWALTGELNYQGGERKTFYSKFPYETAEATFEAGGIWMSTEHVGPLVAGEDEGKETVKTGPARSAEELRGRAGSEDEQARLAVLLGEKQ